MAMLSAAIDCSTDQTNKYFVMAGFVSTADVWVDFDREWRARLLVDNLAYFHMNPFAHATTHPRKPFDKSWIGQEARRRNLLADLLGIIASHAFRKFACIIPEEAFLVFSAESREDFIQRQIVLSGRLIWSEVEVWRRQSGYRNQVEMIFEQGDPGRGPLTEALEEISRQTPIFRHKKDNAEKGIIGFTPLQAADILAFEIQKLAQSEGRPIEEVPFRLPYLELEKLPGNIRMLNTRGAKMMDEWMQVLKYFDKNPLPEKSVN